MSPIPKAALDKWKEYVAQFGLEGEEMYDRIQDGESVGEVSKDLTENRPARLELISEWKKERGGGK